MKKLVCITCYPDPDYVRSRTLRAALADNTAVETIIVKNTSKGAGRYFEVLRQLWQVRQHKPDMYLLNFRGYELLPFVLLLAGRKPVIYDEFINPVLVVEEHRQLKHGIVGLMMGAWKWFGWLYYRLIRRCYAILTDTTAHGEYSSRQSGIAAGKYRALPVGADETVFFPADDPGAGRDGGGPFQVFFYSTGSQPLHGMPVIMQAAERLAGREDIEFLIAGTKGDIAGQVAAARKNGARIRHESWIPFEELPDVIRRAGVCLGGPFGGTPQANVVVTGKTYQFLACQSPVIIGRAPSTSQFSDRQNSIVVPQADPEALADAIAWAADHPAELRRIARAGRELYDAKFSASVIAAELADIIRPLLVAADGEALAGMQRKRHQEQ